MKHTFCRIFFILTLLAPAWAQPPAPGNSTAPPAPGEPLMNQSVVEALRSGRLLMNYENVDLKVLARIMAELTGKNIVLDEGVAGKVTVLSSREVTPAEAWEIFKAALQRANFTVRERAGFVQVIPLPEARREGTLVRNAGQVSRSDMALAVFIMRDGDATAIQNAVRPFVSDPNMVQAYGPGRALIVMERADIVARIAELVKNLDRASLRTTVKTFFLQYAEAEKLAGQIQQTVTRAIVLPGEMAPKVVAFPPTNAIIAQGTQAQIDEIGAIITRLDIPRSAPSTVQKPKYFVYKLQNGQAEEAAKILSQMLAERRALIQQELQQNANRIPGAVTSANGTTAGNTTPAPGGAPPTTDSAGNVTSQATIAFVSAKVSADKETNSVIVYVSPNEYVEIRRMLEALDRPRRQVLVTAVVAEVALSRLLEYGARFQAFTPDAGIVSTFQGGVTEEGLLSLLSGGQFILGTAGGGSRTINVGGRDVKVPSFFAFISANKADRDFNLLSSPRLLTSDHKKAEMKVGNVVPFATGARFSNFGQPLVTYDYKDVGIRLNFTPHISQSDTIRMDIEQELSEVTDFLQQNLGGFGYVVPLISTRKVTTSVSLKDGETLLIGGLISKRTTETINKVPLLGDIPLIGAFFQNLRKEDRKTTLFISLTPHVISHPDDIARLDRAYEQFLHGDRNPSDAQTEPRNTKPSKHPVDSPYADNPSVADPMLQLTNMVVAMPENDDSVRQPRVTVVNGQGDVEFKLVGTVKLPDGSITEYETDMLRFESGQSREIVLPAYRFMSQNGVYEFDVTALVNDRVVARLPLPRRISVTQRK